MVVACGTPSPALPMTGAPPAQFSRESVGWADRMRCAEAGEAAGLGEWLGSRR
jgi:hypothetical protein